MKTGIETENKKEEVNISSTINIPAGRVGFYFKLCIGKKFSECKLNTEDQASQEGCKRFLTGQIKI